VAEIITPGRSATAASRWLLTVVRKNSTTVMQQATLGMCISQRRARPMPQPIPTRDDICEYHPVAHGRRCPEKRRGRRAASSPGLRPGPSRAPAPILRPPAASRDPSLQIRSQCEPPVPFATPPSAENRAPERGRDANRLQTAQTHADADIVGPLRGITRSRTVTSCSAVHRSAKECRPAIIRCCHWRVFTRAQP
jgi:hypothetical protein